jgi:hypothetical protein
LKGCCDVDEVLLGVFAIISRANTKYFNLPVKWKCAHISLVRPPAAAGAGMRVCWVFNYNILLYLSLIRETRISHIVGKSPHFDLSSHIFPTFYTYPTFSHIQLFLRKCQKIAKFFPFGQKNAKFFPIGQKNTKFFLIGQKNAKFFPIGQHFSHISDIFSHISCRPSGFLDN